ncbi:MAG: hypothetical protein ABI658_24155 [Acidimicrobiales bacterium]
MVRSTAPEADTGGGASTSRGPRRVHWLAPVMGAGLGAWVVRRMWGGGLIAGADSTAVSARTDRTIRDVFAHGHLNGWSPYFSIGHDAFLINPPGFSVIVAVIRAASFGQLSSVGAIKVAVLLSFVILPAAVASFARSIGVDRRAAALTGILSLVVSVFAGFGIRGVFETGLYPFQVAAPLFFFALAAIVDTACRPSMRRSTVAALWLAALVLTHILMATVLIYCAACALLVMYLSRRATFGLRSGAALAGSGFGAAALCAVWLYPFAESRHLAGRAATWVPPTFHEQIADVLKGRRLYDSALANLVIVGWLFVVAVALRGRRRGLLPGAIAAGSIVAVHVVRGLYPGDVTSQMPWRAMTSIGVIALIPAAIMIASVTDWLGGLLQLLGRRATKAASLGRHRALLAEVIGVAICAGLVFGIDQRTNLPGELTEPIPEMRQTALLLQTLVPATGRFAVEEDFPAEIGRLGVIAPARWLSWASGRDELNLFNPELNRAAAGLAVREIHSGEPGLAEHLATFGVTHIVSTSEETALRLAQNSDLTLLETRGPLRIWQTMVTDRIDPRALLSADTGTLAASYERKSNEHHRFVVDVSARTTVGIAIAYSPRWKLTVDGRTVTPQVYGDGRLKLELDAGHHDIGLDYRTDWRTIGGAIVSLIALVLALRVLWLTRRQKINDAMPA